jgi:hypothetical protein
VREREKERERERRERERERERENIYLRSGGYVSGEERWNDIYSHILLLAR